LVDILCCQAELYPRGHSGKSIIDPTTCINMHHHYCWGFVPNTSNLNHAVDPDVAVLQHYKKCPRKPEQCREMMKQSHVSSDDTILKFRTELIRAVTQKLKKISS